MNMNVSDRLRCAYEECAEAHPMAKESTYEQVTCPTCRAALGLPPLEIYKSSGATVAATPKPRAGEHVLSPAEQVIADHTAGIHAIIAERDLLRERERELVEALDWAVKRINRSELGHGWSAASVKYDEVYSLLAKHGR